MKSKILVKPIITEKYTAISNKLNQFGFIVATDANKIEIRNVIEATYGVTVESVNTQKYLGKLKIRQTKSGIAKGFANASKKAIVTLKKGDTIDFYSNI